MKKSFLFFVSILLFVTACTPSYDSEEEIVQDTDEEDPETAIIPKYNFSDDEYKIILEYEPGQSKGVLDEQIYKPGKARGVIVNQVFNRYDIDEMEEGLRRHSKSVFDPEHFYFQEGQFLTEEVVYRWLNRKYTEADWEEYYKDHDKNPPLTKEQFMSGLNPTFTGDESDPDAYKKSPRYLSHILEQNYLQKTEENTVGRKGISIALAMKSVYQYQTEVGGPTYYHEISEKEMLKKGKEYAQIILERIRKMEEAQDLPIMFTIYREESQSSLVPGNFVAKTVVDGSDMTIGEWTSIEEDYVLFPSDEADKKYPGDANMMKDFTESVREFFPDYVGVIGKGFYVDGELQELIVEVPIEFKGKGEVIGFTQYAYGLIMEIFSNKYDLEINVQSTNKQEAILYRDAGKEEPEVYIYH
ncbi:CamS family sex pheromone protein [Salirhabdus sp. Marseille-P4669]|uniref:CamS family sex pheromone protein n=1 Tax=Salirhabdus sp. Marseille-P4669 TaxID=2042310 RepID=UPI000C7B433E|nr:CamS family sex pheromone protein [Salirhabdus sp. Marseille-P4669]